MSGDRTFSIDQQRPLKFNKNGAETFFLNAVVSKSILSDLNSPTIFLHLFTCTPVSIKLVCLLILKRNRSEPFTFRWLNYFICKFKRLFHPVRTSCCAYLYFEARIKFGGLNRRFPIAIQFGMSKAFFLSGLLAEVDDGFCIFNQRVKESVRFH